jgi:hypothetical protein
MQPHEAGRLNGINNRIGGHSRRFIKARSAKSAFDSSSQRRQEKAPYLTESHDFRRN